MSDLEWVVQRRGGGVDVVVGLLPTIPVRFSLLTAHQDAAGIGLVTQNLLDENGQPTGEVEETMGQVREPSGDDLVAVAYAALAACWQQPSVKAPTLRECGRDVVEYGEQFITALLEQGYMRDGLVEASAAVLVAIEKSIMRVMGEIRKEEENFETAQPR